ncbi:hypothetical protein WAZ07_19635 [Bacillus sp. FJAT-51639]|uniref:YwqJ-like deaminase n=1 Tax=Bacillus bruguierae TaxID=3127667 RepID=A0ABU8FL67_9BACI
MDVSYKVRAWQDMKDGMNKLTKDTFVNLRQANNLVKDIQERIQDLDSDRSIYFHHKDQLETIGKLHNAYTDLDSYCDQAGQAVYEHIDKPFVETMDRFAQEMRDISIKNFETTNRIGSTTTTIVDSRSYGGTPQTITTTKPKITVDDIFRDSEAFNEVLRAEYEEWKRRDPNMNLDYEEYRRRVPSTRGFEYRSIEDEQKQLEAFRDFGLGVLTVGATFICPPLGVAASLIFGGLQVKSASDGEDWGTHRKLSEGERTERYVSGALEFITSGVGIVKGFQNIGSLGRSSEGAMGFNPNEGKNVVQSLGDNNTLKNALNTVGNTPIPVRVKWADTGIEGVKLPYSEYSTVGEIAGRFAKTDEIKGIEASLAERIGNVGSGKGVSNADIISKSLNDSKTALAEHVEYIKNGGIVKPTGGKFAPSKVSAIVDTKTGKIYYGYSGKTGFNPSRTEVLHEDLQKLIERTKDLAKKDINNPYVEKGSFEKWDVDNCAEIQAVNQALNDGAKIEDMFVRTVNFKTGEFADFCKNCKVTFSEFMKAAE